MKSDKLTVAVITGAALGLIVGYASFQHEARYSVSLVEWLTNDGGPVNAIISAVLGVIATTGLVYLFSQKAD